MGPHGVAKLPHPQRSRLDSGNGLAARGDAEPLLDGLSNPKGREEV